MLPTTSKNDPDWLSQTQEALRYSGGAIVTDVLTRELCERIRSAMYAVQDRTVKELGRERLARAPELGVLRIMVDYDPIFLDLLALPEMLAIIDA
ncbi:MAG TPA: hypothetical protein VK680_10810, partial [Solirubrobacteraceae bacterium]|nr:hypothetical protein [Solirubrobacteraceae bacterium]